MSGHPHYYHHYPSSGSSRIVKHYQSQRKCRILSSSTRKDKLQRKNQGQNQNQKQQPPKKEQGFEKKSSNAPNVYIQNLVCSNPRDIFNLMNNLSPQTIISDANDKPLTHVGLQGLPVYSRRPIPYEVPIEPTERSSKNPSLALLTLPPPPPPVPSHPPLQASPSSSITSERPEGVIKKEGEGVGEVDQELETITLADEPQPALTSLPVLLTPPPSLGDSSDSNYSLSSTHVTIAWCASDHSLYVKDPTGIWYKYKPE